MLCVMNLNCKFLYVIMFNLNNMFTAQLSAEVHSVHMELSYN